jgi:hypothetical protein
MSDQLSSSGGSSSVSVPYQSLPMSALQAMYFAVTGKTESISKDFTRNVRITLEDLRVLHTKILQKLEHFVTPVPPTVTILAKMHNKQSLRYSSWERFQMFEVASNDVTSELIIKYEFLIQLPNIENPQRCVINVTIDSKMPVLKDELDNNFDDDFFMIIGLDRFPTVKLTVEFVDFLVGKEYQQIIEEWFEHLPEVSSPNWAIKASRWGFRKIEILSDVNLIPTPTVQYR